MASLTKLLARSDFICTPSNSVVPKISRGSSWAVNFNNVGLGLQEKKVWEPLFLLLTDSYPRQNNILLKH